MRKGIPQFVGPLLAVAILVCGLIFLGRRAAEQLRERERYTIAFADVDCNPPGALARGEFLGEVQFLAGWSSDQVCLLDEDLPARLAAAFAAHPWVEKVERVEVQVPHVRVQLTHRVPVLVVPSVPLEYPNDRTRWIEACTAKGGSPLSGRVVDRNGILLPAQFDAEMPALFAKVSEPSNGQGSRWGDPRVEAAAAVAALLLPQQNRLHLDVFQFVDDELVLNRLGETSVRVVWGHAPDRETPGEAPAAVKLRRLLDYQAEHGSLFGINEETEFDVRPIDRAVHR
jgi:hypothetical protein